jgi:hypothetical protein
VLYDKNFADKKWFSVKEINSLKINESAKKSVNNAKKLFLEENMRVSFRGVPKIFLSESNDDLLEFNE